MLCEGGARICAYIIGSACHFGVCSAPKLTTLVFIPKIFYSTEELESGSARWGAHSILCVD